MRNLIVIFSIILALGCAEKNEDLVVASKYWNALLAGNTTELEHILADPREIEKYKNMKFLATSVSAAKNNEGFVTANIKRFCYSDLNVKTVVVKINGNLKVDSKETDKYLMEEARKNNKPLKKYCHDFNDNELTGKINAQPWTVKMVDVREVDWGTKKTNNVQLHPEKCDANYSGNCNLPQINVSNLNLEGDGGNMTEMENISIYIPPSYNRIISDGSYRVSHTENGKKLQISFKESDANYLNGYVMLK